MTKEDIFKQFPPRILKYMCFGEMGICYYCEYFKNCDKIFPGFTKPRKCGGPFYRNNSTNK